MRQQRERRAESAETENRGKRNTRKAKKRKTGLHRRPLELARGMEESECHQGEPEDAGDEDG